MAKIAVILNHRAGSTADKQVEEITAAFESRGSDFEILSARSGDIVQLAIQAAQAGCKVLVAGGGDGTVNAVAGVAINKKLCFGVIPAGTLNHFAKDLGLPMDIAGAVEIIVSGTKKKIDYGEAGGKIFLNNASIGVYPTLVRRREKEEKKIGKWPAAARELWHILRKPLKGLRLRIVADGQYIRLTTPFIFIGNNDYHVERVGFSNRTDLSAGHLSFFAYRGSERRGLIIGFIRSTFGLRPREAMISLVPKKVLINTRTKTIEVALDGEVQRLEVPLVLRVRAGGLAVMAPRP